MIRLKFWMIIGSEIELILLISLEMKVIIIIRSKKNVYGSIEISDELFQEVDSDEKDLDISVFHYTISELLELHFQNNKSVVLDKKVEKYIPTFLLKSGPPLEEVKKTKRKKKSREKLKIHSTWLLYNDSNKYEELFRRVNSWLNKLSRDNSPGMLNNILGTNKEIDSLVPLNGIIDIFF